MPLSVEEVSRLNELKIKPSALTKIHSSGAVPIRSVVCILRGKLEQYWWRRRNRSPSIGAVQRCPSQQQTSQWPVHLQNLPHGQVRKDVKIRRLSKTVKLFKRGKLTVDKLKLGELKKRNL